VPDLLRCVRNFASSFGNGIAGLAAIEFAIIGPILVLMLVCMVDLGSGIYGNMQVENAAQAGAEYAAVHGFDVSSISNAVTSANLFPGIGASPAPSQFCGCPSSTGITTVACSATCVSGSSAGVYVAVSSTGTYTTLLPYPLLPRSFTFASRSTVRIQ
jgi:Flp pilus assembly protein TadG